MATRRRGPRGSVPGMMKHSSGQARVCLSGQIHYLGKFGSVQAAEKYAALVKAWEAGGRQPLRKVATVRTAVPIAEVFERWETYLDETGRYQKNGKETSHRGAVRVVVRDFCKMFGQVATSKFSDRHLLQFRDELEKQPRLSRKGINRKIGLLRAGLRWAFNRGLIHRDQWLGVTAIEPITRAEAGNRGRKLHKRAVTVEEVESVAACLPRIPAAMLRPSR